MIEQIWIFIKQNITPTAIISGIVIQLIIFLFKKIAIFGSKISLRYAKKTNVKNATKIIEYLEDDLDKIRKLKNKNFDTLLDITDKIYNNLVFITFTIVMFLIVDGIKPYFEDGIFEIVYISVVFSSSKYFSKSLLNLVSNFNLINKSKNFEKYRLQIEKEINFWHLLKDNQQNPDLNT